MNYRNIDKIQSNSIADNLTEAGDKARRRRGSGSKWYAKGDAISQMFLVEAKAKVTPSKTRTISKEVFDMLKLEALEENKVPLYVVGFGDNRDFYILEDRDLAEIIQRMLSAEREVNELKARLIFQQNGECDSDVGSVWRPFHEDDM